MSALLLAFLFAADPLLARLLKLETQIYAAWQSGSIDAVIGNVAEDGIAWGEYGEFDKPKQVEMQRGANKACKVTSFALRDAHLLKVSADTAMLLYTADQDADCGGGKAPTPIHNSTLYVRRNGVWKVIYRASVVPKT